MTLTELPFDLPGRVFRSPMPFSLYDPQGEIMAQYHEENVSTVVMLVSDDEALEKIGRNLRSFYTDRGLEVIYFPIPDFWVPASERLDPILTFALERAQQGKNVAVHCNAGLGRTGLFVACLARRVFGYNGEQAIQWVRQYIPEAVENPYQYRFVVDF